MPGQQNYSSDLIQFSALVQDLEDAPEDLSIQWSSNIDGPLILDTTPDSSGEMFDYTYLSEGQHAIELSVTDSSGKTTAEEVVIRVGGVNNIPGVQSFLPMINKPFYWVRRFCLLEQLPMPMSQAQIYKSSGSPIKMAYWVLVR